MEDFLSKFTTDEVDRGQAALEIQAKIDENKLEIQAKIDEKNEVTTRIANDIETLEDALKEIRRTYFRREPREEHEISDAPVSDLDPEAMEHDVDSE